MILLLASRLYWDNINLRWYSSRISTLSSMLTSSLVFLDRLTTSCVREAIFEFSPRAEVFMFSVLLAIGFE